MGQWSLQGEGTGVAPGGRGGWTTTEPVQVSWGSGGALARGEVLSEDRYLGPQP